MEDSAPPFSPAKIITAIPDYPSSFLTTTPLSLFQASISSTLKTTQNATQLHLDIKIENINYQSIKAKPKSMDSKNLILFRDWNLSQLKQTGKEIYRALEKRDYLAKKKKKFSQGGTQRERNWGEGGIINETNCTNEANCII